jgi:NAD(P)-dependent dehydrogenase (short-subunit alcohol dehydrogenase family)
MERRTRSRLALMPATFELRGLEAVVIGASQGIGAAIAVALAAAGADVVVAARRREQLEEIRDQVAAQGARAFAETVDVGSTDSIAALLARVSGLGLAPAILVNCAGEGGTRAAFDVTPAEWDAMHDVHLRGTFFACQAFGRGMAERGYGKIVNMSSTWAATVGVNRSVYCAAKAGVGHLTAALATEWAPHGIRVNALAPTATLTPTIERRLAQDPARAEYLRRGIPLGRLATPDDIVGSAVFLASPASDFVTGHTLFVDGGWKYAK